MKKQSSSKQIKTKRLSSLFIPENSNQKIPNKQKEHLHDNIQATEERKQGANLNEININKGTKKMLFPLHFQNLFVTLLPIF